MKKLKLNSAIWSIATPFPKTKMYEIVKRNLIRNPINSTVNYYWNIEPFFENKKFTKDEIKHAYIINNIKAGNYFISRNFISMANLFLNLRYDLYNLPIHIFNISKEIVKKLLY